MDLLGNAEKILHVVSYLVSNDVGLGKIARRAELPIKLPEERQIQVDFAVSGTVEGPAR